MSWIGSDGNVREHPEYDDLPGAGIIDDNDNLYDVNNANDRDALAGNTRKNGYFSDIEDVGNATGGHQYDDDINNVLSTILSKSGINPNDIPSAYYSQLMALCWAYMRADGNEMRQEALINLSEFLGTLQNYLYTELGYQRSLPVNQISNLIAAGLSPTAAKAMLSDGGSQLDVPQAADLTASAESGERLDIAKANTIMNGVSQFTDSVMNIINGAYNARAMNYNLRAAEAAAQMQSVGASSAAASLDGQNAATALMQVIGYYQNLGQLQSGGSFDHYVGKIRSFADGGDPYAQSFINDILPGLNTYYGRKYSNEMLNGNVDNDYYARDKIAALRLQNVQSDLIIQQTFTNAEELNKIIAETEREYAARDLLVSQNNNELKRGQLLDSQINLTDEQTEAQRISNAAARLDLDIKDATFSDCKAISMQQVHDMLLQLQVGTPDEKRAVLKTMLADRDRAMYVACLAKAFASKQSEYWSNPAYSEQMKLFAAFSNENVQEAFRTYALSAEIESSSITVHGGAWGVPTAAYVTDLMYGTQGGLFRSSKSGLSSTVGGKYSYSPFNPNPKR